jgi:hypothetical protein
VGGHGQVCTQKDVLPRPEWSETERQRVVAAPGSPRGCGSSEEGPDLGGEGSLAEVVSAKEVRRLRSRVWRIQDVL